MNKKLTIISLLSCLCMSMTACESTENFSSNNVVNNVSEKEWLVEVSHTATDSLLELTNDDIYIKAYTNSQEITDLVKGWQGAEINTNEIYVTYISENDAETFLKFSGDIDYGNLSSVAKKSIYNKMGQTIPNYIAGCQGVNYIAAVSILNCSVSYAVEYDIDNQVWFMPTDKDGLAVCVSFNNSGEDVVSVSSSYLYYGDEENLKDTLDTYLSYMGLKAEALN